MAGQAAPSTRPLLLLFLFVVPLSSSAADEGAALLRFKATISGSGSNLPSWVPGAAPCSVNYTTWDGVICFNGRVRGVQLEDKGLTGSLDLAPLTALRGLRTLSFMSNDLEGPLPDLSRLGALKAVYFSNNRFSGEISDAAFGGMRSLKKILLSNNQFSGPIPTSLAGLGKLLEARLDHNRFVGRIPDFSQPELEKVDVSFNRLEGPIPERFSKMDASLFQGNEGLCGAPLSAACDEQDIPKKSLSVGILAVIILASIVALLILIFISFIFLRRRRQAPAVSPSPSKRTSEDDRLEQGIAGHHRVSSGSASPASSAGGEGKAAGGGKKGGRENEHGRLAFVQEGRERFELQDLLRASAEVLGSGNLGASYKASLSVGTTVVVKRFKEMNGVGREDFNEHMRRMGRLSHPNVLPLVAYFYKKEEKLLVSDFVANGSLAHMLHGNIKPAGNAGSTVPRLDWPTRLKIVKGVARGLAYLYDELPVLSLPHGHIKSSNVLLDEYFEPLLADYALAPVMNTSTASQVMVAYKSPEAIQFGRPSKKSDVWCLGILILEVLTGKFPANFLQKGKSAAEGADLLVWVSSVAQEDWSSEVFDGDMSVVEVEWKEEMHRLLKIGMDCCEDEVEKRLDMREALQRIEEIKEARYDSEVILIGDE